MKTINALFLSVIVKEEAITTALHFDLDEAKDIMIHTLAYNFDPEKDEGLIFEAQKTGEAVPVFNYRAHISGEVEEEREVAKENKHVKFFFDCPKCHGTEGKLKADEDGDIIMVCKGCKSPVLVQ